MATQKEVKNRISSVKNIHKITRAMEMVAAARLRRAEQRIDAMRPYAQAIRKMTREVAEAAEGVSNRLPLLQQRDLKRVTIALVTGDRGLAGGFNSQIVREGIRLRKEFEADGAEVSFVVVGRRGNSTMTFRGEDVSASYVGFTDRPGFLNAREISHDLVQSYRDEEVDRVDVIYNRYVSPLTQYVRRQTLLPVQEAEVFGEGLPEPEKPADEELAEAHAEVRPDLRARRRDPLADAVRGVRGPVHVSRAPRVGRVRARRADDRDAQRVGERGHDDRRPDPGDEPGAPVGDHPGNLGSSRRGGSARLKEIEWLRTEATEATSARSSR